VQFGAIKLCGGKIFADEHSASIDEVMRLYFGELEGEILGTGRFKVSRQDDSPLGYPATFWENGLAAAEVEVDEMTGAVKIVNYVSFTDAGKMIHPLHCRGQEEGSVLFGISHALYEQLVYINGQLSNPNVVDYRLPRFRDLPQYFIPLLWKKEAALGPLAPKVLRRRNAGGGGSSHLQRSVRRHRRTPLPCSSDWSNSLGNP
jgi:xanthine dehydrogenase molybdopterin-binding subunit B